MSRKIDNPGPGVRDLERRFEGQEPDLADPDNPEWTKADFARAVGPDGLSAVELAHFPRTRALVGRGGQAAATKRAISIRLDPEVVEHFKAGGRGWQSRINAALLDAIAHKRA